MTFGRLTLGFGLLGLFAVELLVVIGIATEPADSIEIFSNGEVLFWGGVAGLIGGAVLGVFVWAVCRVISVFGWQPYTTGRRS